MEGAAQLKDKLKGKLKGNAKIQASKANVVQQAKLMDSAGTAWHAVKYGNLEMITRLFPSQCNVYSKGPVGDNCFHIALLLNTPSTLAIAKYLVKLYGKTLVNTPYQERKHETDPPGQYEGETALHIAIVNRDFDMVKFLIQAGADVLARCYGDFFKPGSPVNYGEYPLSFAACTGQKDIVSYLKRHGARVNHDRDMYGNTALHLCVVHDQIDMYDHLVEYCGASEHVRNNRGQTPLLLAASLGKLEMFQHIYNRRRKVAWAYGPVTSYSLSLHEIDTVQNSRAFIPSALETIVRKGHMNAIDDPLVKTLLSTKWQRFAGLQFSLQAFCYAVLMIVQSFLVWLHCDKALFNSYSREALEICSLLLAAAFFILELVDLACWSKGVAARRKLMKANPRYCPPLYPIPGETTEAPTKAKSGFFSRMMKKDGQPVAEAHLPGGQAQPAQLAHGGASTQQFVPWNPEVDGTSGQVVIAVEEAKAMEAGEAAGPSAGHASWAVSAYTSSGPGPVAEGREGGATPKGNVQFAQVDDVGVQRVHSSTGPQAAATRPSFNKQMSLQHRNAALSSAQVQAIADAPVDIVSVGIASPAVSAMPQLLPQPSFFARQQDPATSMLGRAGEGVPPGVQPPGGFGEGVPGGTKRTGSNLGPGGAAGSAAPGVGPTSPGGEKDRVSIGRDSSEIGSTMGQEIRNRIRGGGGGDLPAGAASANIRRADNKKADNKKDDDVAAEDDREPLHVGGVRGVIGWLGHSLVSYYRRQAADPSTVIMVVHIMLTFTHFITWASTYGAVDGHGPHSANVREFDDIVVSLMALTGWFAMLYFARGAQFTGQMAVVIEMCTVEVFKFVCLYFIFNIGFTLAFYTVLNGTTNAVQGRADALPNFPVPFPFESIGTGMMQVLRFLYGEAEYETYAATPYRSKRAIATIYFITYIAATLLLLANLLTAMIMHTFNARNNTAEQVWKLRWACYVLRAEARLPRGLQQRYRLGEVAYDPALQMRVYNHVFEVVDDQSGGKHEDKDKEVAALEAALERLRKGKGGSKQ